MNTSTHAMVVYWAPKAGTAVSDWEDGAAYDTASGWFAVADGASSGANSREWAYTLVENFVSDRPGEALPDGAVEPFLGWLDRARSHFDPSSDQFPKSRMPAWVQSAGARSGAHATFLGGRINPDSVEVVAVGDCCLVHVQPTRGRLVTFPMTRAEDFDSSPTLVRSLPGADQRLSADLRWYRAPLDATDVLFAASDAMAQWMVGNSTRPEVWAGLQSIGVDGFGPLCERLRENGEMKNDDVTLWRAVPARQLAGAR